MRSTRSGARERHHSSGSETRQREDPPDGKVKVLDFGLAKALESEARRQSVAFPDVEHGGDECGRDSGHGGVYVAGAGEGPTVDKRTDIFAFGCVLYEMLTGRAAFDGETCRNSRRGAGARAGLERLPAETPAEFGTAARCLEKNGDRRCDRHDARIEIEEGHDRPGRRRLRRRRARRTPASRSGSQSRRRWSLRCGWPRRCALSFARPRREVPRVRVGIVTPPSPPILFLALSPDGRTVVFVASGDGASPFVATAAWRQLGATAGRDRGRFPVRSGRPTASSVGFLQVAS